MAHMRIAPDWEIWRLRIVYAFMMLAFCAVGAQLWNIQVSRSEEFRQNELRQSVRNVRVPGVRGLIYDRNGTSLAENRPSFGIELNLEQCRPVRRKQTKADRILETIAEIERRIDLPCGLSTNELKTHIVKRLPLPLIAWSDLPDDAVARWAERASSLQGVELRAQAVRVYPHGTDTCHIVGYVGRAAAETNTEEVYHYQLPEMEGRSGIEKQYDGLLSGQAGGRMVSVDVAGYRRNDVGGHSPQAGMDLMLTIDLRVQQLALQALDGKPGSVVVIDPGNGDVLAMVSTPGYDPNLFVPSIPGELWSALRDDPAKPLVNRAVAGAYAPGSTFKPIVAIAAMQRKTATPGTTQTCPGYFMLGRHRINCWDKLGHGTVDLPHAIRYSCNVFFFHAGLECGAPPIIELARSAGLGRRTGIDLDYEVSGLVPDAAWKRRKLRDGWREGDTCNLSIGQGALSATPLQMARLAAALANGGRLVQPHLLLATRPHGTGVFTPRLPAPPADLGWDAAAVNVVRNGMRDVVMAEDGTGRKIRVAGFELAGKTGTAEYGIKGEGRKRGWMIAFAPFDQPRFAAAMILEDAISGGTSVAPRLQVLFEGLLRPAAPEEGRG